MAFTPNIYYPTGYQPFNNAYQPMQNNQMGMSSPQSQPSQQNNGLIWVSGEIGAKSYLMTPNSTVMLMDSEQNKFYIKSTDSAGMPTLKAYEYTECLQNASQGLNMDLNKASEQFVTREEYRALMGKYESLLAQVNELKKNNIEVKEVVDNE